MRIARSLLPCSTALVLLLTLTGVLWSQVPPEPQPLVVATKNSPPFAIKSPEGEWTGISIELWKHLADELNLAYEFRELSLNQMLNQLERGQLDAAVAAISVTADRHQRVDFCHPHFTTGLGIAVSTTHSTTSWSLLRRIVSAPMLILATLMVCTVVICGLLFWLVERKRNTNAFGGDRRQGIGMGVWWSLILLLGHKGVIPISLWGRIVAACSMLASIFLLSLLTGVIASVLTVQQLEIGIAHPSDLRHVRTVTVADSTSAEYLRRRQIGFQSRGTVEQALQALLDHQADAVVYDEALLKYMAKTQFAEQVQVLPIVFNTQEYAIALPPDSNLRKLINEAMLRFRASDSWDELVYRYLGN